MAFSRRSAFLLAMCLAAVPSRGDVPDALNAIRADLSAGRADDALARLSAALASRPTNAEAHNLRCRVLLQEKQWDAAISDCEQAARIAPGSSDYHLWLGRAYGEKANRVNFISAYRLAKLVRQEFETAARLDPHNANALSDLGEYYTDAPSFLGGGTDKAAAVASRLESFAPQQGHALKAQIAAAEKDYAGAEQEWKASIAAAEDPAKGWMDLASFYRGRRQWDQMEAAIKTGASLDKDRGAALADGASTLTRSKRDPQLAIALLREYLASPHKSEDAPAFRVHTQLAKLLAGQGDTTAAAAELAQAKSLAGGYQPADAGITHMQP